MQNWFTDNAVFYVGGDKFLGGSNLLYLNQILFFLDDLATIITTIISSYLYGSLSNTNVPSPMNLDRNQQRPRLTLVCLLGLYGASIVTYCKDFKLLFTLRAPTSAVAPLDPILICSRLWKRILPWNYVALRVGEGTHRMNINQLDLNLGFVCNVQECNLHWHT